MFRSGAATAADDVDAEISGEVCDLRCERFGRLAVMLRAVFDFRQTRVWQHRDGQRRVLAEIADALRHVLWASTAVHADDINRERLKRSQRGANLRAVEHRAEDFDGYLSNDGKATLDLLEVIEDGGERSFRLQQILACFDDEEINAAIVETAYLFAVSGLE